MRRLLPLLGLALLLAGCGGGETVSPTAETVVGTLPKTETTTTTQTAAGDPQSGAKLFTSQGCGGCHAFQPAGTNADVGPDLDDLEEDARKADRGGSFEDFARESIVDPAAYIEPGYQNVMPDFGDTLSDKQVADLVAFLTQQQQ
jgi:mono/diheme cytochrome c family protein